MKNGVSITPFFFDPRKADAVRFFFDNDKKLNHKY